MELSPEPRKDCGEWAGEAGLSTEEGSWELLEPEAVSGVSRMSVTHLLGVDWSLQAARARGSEGRQCEKGVFCPPTASFLFLSLTLGGKLGLSWFSPYYLSNFLSLNALLDFVSPL